MLQQYMLDVFTLLGIVAKYLHRVLVSHLYRLIINVVFDELLLDGDQVAGYCFLVEVILQEVLAEVDKNDHVAQKFPARMLGKLLQALLWVMDLHLVVLVDVEAVGDVVVLLFVECLLLHARTLPNRHIMHGVSLLVMVVGEVVFELLLMDTVFIF